VTRVSEAIHGALLSAQDREIRRQEQLELAKGLRISWAEGLEVLYKFKSLAGESRGHTLDIIENSRVYFSSPSQFNDPFDCSPRIDFAQDIRDPSFVAQLREDEQRMARESGMTELELEKLRAAEGVPVERMAEAVRANILAELRRDTRVFCLTTELRHPLMWSHYASSHTGICLHFSCAPGSLFGLARRVIYRRDRPAILIPLKAQSEDEITERMVFEKAQFWDYESEYRIIGHYGVHWGHGFDSMSRVEFPPELLCGITLGMQITQPDRADILALAASHKPAIPVWQASESPACFWLEAERVP
jgi:hypothetical protein